VNLGNHKNDEPLVSVCIQTYQHAPYIRQALDSVLMQKTDFPYEILIGEDESTDGTREICMEYAEKHPDIIRLFLNSRENVIYINGQATGRWNFINNIINAKGSYIALLPGDDYWTDPLKLQKQIAYLKKEKDCVACFHCVKQEFLDVKKNRIACKLPSGTKYSLLDMVTVTGIVPCSFLFRKSATPFFPEWFYHVPSGDKALFSIIAQKGNLGYINECMGVHRHHGKGIWTKLSLYEQIKNEITLRETICDNIFDGNKKAHQKARLFIANKCVNIAKKREDYQISIVEAIGYLFLALKLAPKSLKNVF